MALAHRRIAKGGPLGNCHGGSSDPSLPTAPPSAAIGLFAIDLAQPTGKSEGNEVLYEDRMQQGVPAIGMMCGATGTNTASKTGIAR